MKHNDLCVGIDLGTTNSVIATCSTDMKRIETPICRIERYTDMSSRNNARKESRELLPSCVYYSELKGNIYEPIVGDFAKTVSRTQPFAVAKSIKKQMGLPSVTIPGWKKEYPDQTPEAVSARILRHLLDCLEDYYGETITDAVITVPASFNPAQREATLRAAEIAGLEVRESNGNYRDDVLLSEPEAVIYDVLNQVQNGKINLPIDFNTQKKVLVFDIGGGTLDITLHEIQRVTEAENHFEIRPIATNRYSTVAGDQFDQRLADWMYQQYLAYYRAENKDIAKRIEDNPQSAIPFLAYAEELKIKISDRYKDRKRRGNPLDKEYSFDYGGYMPNGYNSENSITLAEFEDVLSPLLGENYNYDDYTHFEDIKNDNNIIFPILNVLYKATKILNSDNINVDAVILNGGMSRLYLIENRLTQFFNLKPITINDPDKSVAQGAAVYHYYLHQDDQARELHRLFLETQERLEQNANLNKESPTNILEDESLNKIIGIQSLSNVLNESIYLGLKGGAVYCLAESGQELPYESPVLTNFSISQGQKLMRIPIKQMATGENYITIASGDIVFREAAKRDFPVAIKFLLRKNGTITLQAWTYSGKNGTNVIEQGTVNLSFNTTDSDNIVLNRGRKVLPPAGTNLIVANELSSFENLINKLKKEENSKKRYPIIGKIKQLEKTISSCGNPEEFAEASLGMLKDSSNVFMNINYLPVARNLARYWPDEKVSELSSYCISILYKELSGYYCNGFEIRANIEAIKTIIACNISEDVEQIQELKTVPQYKKAFLDMEKQNDI